MAQRGRPAAGLLGSLRQQPLHPASTCPTRSSRESGSFRATLGPPTCGCTLRSLRGRPAAWDRRTERPSRVGTADGRRASRPGTGSHPGGRGSHENHDLLAQPLRTVYKPGRSGPGHVTRSGHAERPDLAGIGRTRLRVRRTRVPRSSPASTCSSCPNTADGRSTSSCPPPRRDRIHLCRVFRAEVHSMSGSPRRRRRDLLRRKAGRLSTAHMSSRPGSARPRLGRRPGPSRRTPEPAAWCHRCAHRLPPTGCVVRRERTRNVVGVGREGGRELTTADRYRRYQLAGHRRRRPLRVCSGMGESQIGNQRSSSGSMGSSPVSWARTCISRPVSRCCPSVGAKG